ncbi:MAG TPA: UDP-N-acetylmuramate--L-alanine ligase [Solirubrobacteraceae bacterium]|jgi:UDP-N-acetylmuramate--alanine ligase|nr:UDP-N-acetylmuramate--L-alanine ligase [Solirubrobacteraceae bacterium]
MSGGEAPWRGRRLHFVGVGGAGLSAYARAARELGAEVSGSDSASSPYLERLAADGVLQAAVGHGSENVPAGKDVEVVYSSAVPEENVERAEARRRGLRERPRAEILSELSALRRTIAVAGTHGKTTTAAMILHALLGAGLDPGWLIGGAPGAGLANAHWSAGEWLVIEADESDRSMLSLEVEIALLTSAELDHHAAFASLAELHGAFAEFLARATRAAVVRQLPELLALAGGVRGELVPYGAGEYELTRGGARFAWRELTVQLRVPGAHNVANARGALEVAELAGAAPAAAVEALSRFTGAGRRFELLGESERGALIYDDYAHHPTEVAATLAAARTLEPERLLAVFQPHLFSRTALLAREFGRALAGADVACLLEVYPARERASDYPGVSGLLLAERTADASAGRPVYWLPRFADAEGVLRGLLRRGDLCLVMGAGDVDALAHRLVAR